MNVCDCRLFDRQTDKNRQTIYFRLFVRGLPYHRQCVRFVCASDDDAAAEGGAGAGAGAGGGGASTPRESSLGPDKAERLAGRNWNPAEQLLLMTGMEALRMVPGWEFDSKVQ